MLQLTDLIHQWGRAGVVGRPDVRARARARRRGDATRCGDALPCVQSRDGIRAEESFRPPSNAHRVWRRRPSVRISVGLFRAAVAQRLRGCGACVGRRECARQRCGTWRSRSAAAAEAPREDFTMDRRRMGDRLGPGRLQEARSYSMPRDRTPSLPVPPFGDPSAPGLDMGGRYVDEEACGCIQHTYQPHCAVLEADEGGKPARGIPELTPRSPSSGRPGPLRCRAASGFFAISPSSSIAAL
eukprot:356712-Chlamydomonas_euryale.AAC.9